MTTNSKTDCKGKSLCQYDSLTRTKFFSGMLLTADHLSAEQTYLREALKRLNRNLWGSGIVCGLEVSQPKTGLCIKVQPGFALDCDGNAIEVCTCTTIDLSDLCKKAYPDGCAPEQAAEITKYLVLCYKEIPADPQPVLTPDDECGAQQDGPKCEASKYREGFCFEFRDECPKCCTPCDDEEKDGKPGLLPFLFTLSRHLTDESEQRCEEEKPGCMASPPCCDCHCEDCAVGLAKLVIDCARSTVTVSCGNCRHYVWSPRLLQWLACRLLAHMDRVSPHATGLRDKLPTAGAFIRNPLDTMWEVGGLALGSRPILKSNDEIDNIRSRAAAVEKPPSAKAKPKPEP